MRWTRASADNNDSTARHHHDIRLEQPLPDDPQPADGAQRRRHLAGSGLASGAAHAATRRQRGRCGDRRGRCADHRRAGVQRPGQRQLRDPVGRQSAARPELVGCRARGLEPGLLPQEIRHEQRRQDADARLGHRHHAGRGGGLGGAVRALRQAAVCRPAGAGHRAGRTRPWRGRDRGRQMAPRHALAARLAGLCRGLHAARPRTRAGRALRVLGRRRHAAPDRADQGRGLLPRRNRREAGGACQRQRRQHDAVRSGQLPA